MEKQKKATKSNKTKPSKKALEEQMKLLKEELENERRKSEDYLSRLKYLQADFENYRKRTQKEITDSIQRSNEKLVSCLINILDDLEAAVLVGEKTENKNALLEGVKMVHKNLEKLLHQEGLERLECVGRVFDPCLHEVLAQVPTDEHQEGVVVEEARKGFLFRGKVLRPSVVKVACKMEGETE